MSSARKPQHREMSAQRPVLCPYCLYHADIDRREPNSVRANDQQIMIFENTFIHLQTHERSRVHLYKNCSRSWARDSETHVWLTGRSAGRHLSLSLYLMRSLTLSLSYCTRFVILVTQRFFRGQFNSSRLHEFVHCSTAGTFCSRFFFVTRFELKRQA